MPLGEILVIRDAIETDLERIVEIYNGSIPGRRTLSRDYRGQRLCRGCVPVHGHRTDAACACRRGENILLDRLVDGNGVIGLFRNSD